MAEVRRAGTRNCGPRVFVSRRDGCLGPRPAAMAAGAGRGLRALTVHLHRAADRRSGAVPRAASRRARTQEAPAPPAGAGRQSPSSARPERPERRGASAGAPSWTQARGAEQPGAGGFRGKSEFRGSRVCPPRRLSEGSSTPSLSGGHGPSFPRVDPAPGPLPTSEGPSPPHLRGWCWPCVAGAQALLLSLCLPGSSPHRRSTAPPARRSSSTPTRIPRRRFTHRPAVPLCSQEARRLAQNVQDRSAGRDFLDGGEAAGVP